MSVKETKPCWVTFPANRHNLRASVALLCFVCVEQEYQIPEVRTPAWFCHTGRGCGLPEVLIGGAWHCSCFRVTDARCPLSCFGEMRGTKRCRSDWKLPAGIRLRERWLKTHYDKENIWWCVRCTGEEWRCMIADVKPDRTLTSCHHPDWICFGWCRSYIKE